MSSSFEVDVNPAVLQWARESIGLSLEEAARKAHTDKLAIQMWEVGGETPKLSDLRKMAEAYQRPLAVFLLPQPPAEEPVIRTDFRLLPQNQNRQWSTEFSLSWWRIKMQRDVAVDIAEVEDDVPPNIDIHLSLNDDPEIAGGRIRRWLLTPDVAVSSSRKSFLTQWTTIIETKSILVTQASSIQVEEMRGCSISDQPFPIILLNSSDTQRGRVFTLMHELAHVLLNAGGVCDLEDKKVNGSGSNEKERIERFCNQIAATVLMPRASVLRLLQSTPPVLTNKRLNELSAVFGVSQEAMLLRLVTLGRASWDFYKERQAHYLEVYEERQKDQRGFLPYYPQKVRDFGRRYVTTVLDAYHRDIITGPELSTYLDMKINNIPGLEGELGVPR